MSGFVILQQPASELLSIVLDTTNGCANSQDLGHHLRPDGGLKIMSHLEPCRSE